MGSMLTGSPASQRTYHAAHLRVCQSPQEVNLVLVLNTCCQESGPIFARLKPGLTIQHDLLGRTQNSIGNVSNWCHMAWCLGC
jgi:hypothetical protein